jgi:hypothetical protein
MGIPGLKKELNGGTARSFTGRTQHVFTIIQNMQVPAILVDMSCLMHMLAKTDSGDGSCHAVTMHSGTKKDQEASRSDMEFRLLQFLKRFRDLGCQPTVVLDGYEHDGKKDESGRRKKVREDAVKKANKIGPDGDDKKK